MRGMLSSMFGRHHQIDNIDNKDNKDAMEEYLNEDAFTDTVDDLILRARDAINRFIKNPPVDNQGGTSKILENLIFNSENVPEYLEQLQSSHPIVQLHTIVNDFPTYLETQECSLRMPEGFSARDLSSSGLIRDRVLQAIKTNVPEEIKSRSPRSPGR